VPDEKKCEPMKEICYSSLELGFSIQIWLSVLCPRPCET